MSSFTTTFGVISFCKGEYTQRARKGDPGKKGAAGSSKIIFNRFNIVS